MALDFPVLWSEIDHLTASLGWLRELLRRSKEAPLDVTSTSRSLRFHDPLLEDFIAEVLTRYLRRMRSLSLEQTFGRPGDVNLFKGPAPFLARLQIRCCPPRGPLSDQFYECLNHPDNSRLQRLESDFVPSDWSQMKPSQLAHLKITSSNYLGEVRVDLAGSLSALVRTGFLEDLVVEGALV